MHESLRERAWYAWYVEPHVLYSSNNRNDIFYERQFVHKTHVFFNVANAAYDISIREYCSKSNLYRGFVLLVESAAMFLVVLFPCIGDVVRGKPLE